MRRYAPLLFILALATTVASARVFNFAWDAGLNYPVGTTYELESNGVSQSGITGTTQSLDLPVVVGDTINAQVRAVPPAGYQCGTPLALCPPSDWATMVPLVVVADAAIVPGQATGVWATKALQGTGMTAPTLVSYTEVAWNTTTTTANSASISWQTGDVIVVIQGNEGYQAALVPAVPTATGLTFNSQQYIAPVSSNPPCTARVSTAVAGSSGSGAIALGDGTSGADWGAGIWVWRGSAGVGNSVQQATATKTVALTPTGADSAIVWAAFDYVATTPVLAATPTPTHTRQAAVVSGHYGYYVADLVDQPSSGAVSYGVSGTSSGPFSIVVLEIKGSGGVAANWLKESYWTQRATESSGAF